jgi:large subunit ribosomal protein L22
MATDIRAHSYDIAISAQKLRLVVDLIRGKSAQDALNILKFEPSKPALPLSKLVSSAVANAEKNVGIGIDELYVHAITADEAPTRKWRRFGARGRFKPWLRRRSHVTVVLRERVLTAAQTAARSAKASQAADKPAATAKPKKAAKAPKAEKSAADKA